MNKKTITKETLVESLYDYGFEDSYINKILRRIKNTVEIGKLVDIIREIEETEERGWQ
jgi:hypothetical protein